MIAGRLNIARTEGGVPAVVIGERFWREKLLACLGPALRAARVDPLVALRSE